MTVDAGTREVPQELRDRAVRLVRESDRAIAQIAADFGIHREALRTWVGQAEDDAEQRSEQLASAERPSRPLRGPCRCAVLLLQIIDVHEANYGVSGVCRVHKQLQGTRSARIGADGWAVRRSGG